MTELEVAKNIIITYIGKGQTHDGLYDIMEINSGNKEVLLEHINTIISIFQDAKKQLEEDKNEIQDE